MEDRGKMASRRPWKPVARYCACRRRARYTLMDARHYCPRCWQQLGEARALGIEEEWERCRGRE